MTGKSFRNSALVAVLMLAGTFSLPAFGQSVTRSLIVTRQAKLAGQVLSQGKYSISFDDKKDGELVVLKDGREVSKASYKIVDLAKDAAENAVVFTAATDGSLQIRRIEIKGWKQALQFE